MIILGRFKTKRGSWVSTNIILNPRSRNIFMILIVIMVTTSIMITMVDSKEALETPREMDMLAITITMDNTAQILNTEISARCSVTNARTRVIMPMSAQ